MKQYLIDELRLEDHERIKAYLNETIQTSPMDGLYWVLLEKDLLAGAQAAHPDCGPHYFALELHEGAGNARSYCNLLRERGILAKDTHGQTIRFAPALVIKKEDIDWAMEQIEAVLE